MSRRRKRQLRKLLSTATILSLTLPSLFGLTAKASNPKAEAAMTNGNGLVVTKSVSKTDVWREFPEDRLVEYEITVENTDACAEAPIDAMLVMDRSGSMDDDSYCVGNSSTTKYWCEFFGGTWILQPLIDAKDAAKGFIDLLTSPKDYVGLVSYSASATLDHGLSADHNAVKASIDAMTTGATTNIGDAIGVAHTEFTNKGRQGDPDYAVPVMILLTDGIANVGSPDGETYAEAFADAAKADGIRLIVIGLGDDVNESWLRNEIASSTDDYYPAPDSSDLADIFASIQATLGDSIDTVLTDDISDILIDADLWQFDGDGTYGSYDAGTKTLTWDLGTLTCQNGNGSAIVHFSVVVHDDAPDGDIMDNMASATNECGAYAESNVVHTEIHTLDKWDSDDPVEPGETFTYTIEMATGDYAVDDVIITDYLDEDVEYVSSSHSGVYDSGTHTVTWNLGAQGPHAYGTVTVEVKVEDPWDDHNMDDMIYNEASIQLVYPTPIQLSYSTTGMCGEPVWVYENTDVEFILLEVEKLDDPDPVEAGGTLTYTLSYKNNGNMPVYDAVIVETYDPLTTFVSASPAPDVMTNNQWTLGTLNPGDAGIITITVQVPTPLDDGTMVYNYVELQYFETEEEAIEDGVQIIFDEEYTEVNSSLIFTMSKSDTPDPVEAGQIVSYTLTYENIGNMVASAVQIIDALPSEMSYVAGTSEIDGIPVGDPSGTNPYTWDLLTLTGDGDLVPDGPHTITFDVIVDETILDGTMVTDAATVLGTYLDQDETLQNVSSDDTEDTTIVTPILGITKVNDAPAAGVNPGDTITFTVVVVNGGGADSVGTIITDTLPAGVTYVAGSTTLNGVAVGDPTGTNPYTWTVGTLPANGGAATLTYDVTVDADATEGVYSNGSFADADNILDPTDLVTSTFTVVIPDVLGEETGPGEVLGATGSAAIFGMIFGLTLLIGTVSLRRKKYMK